MSEFQPLTSQLGVAGTSYRIQLGKTGDSWAARILRGKEVIASMPMEDLNGNTVVGFVMRETAIPNLDPYQIMKTVQFLTREAKGNELAAKAKGGGIPKPEPAKEAPAPAASEPKEMDKDLMTEEDIRATYRVEARPADDSPSIPAQASGKRKAPKLVSSTGRKLNPIPSAEAPETAAAEATSHVAPAATPASSPSTDGKALSLAERAALAKARASGGAGVPIPEEREFKPLYEEGVAASPSPASRPAAAASTSGGAASSDVLARLSALEEGMKRLEDKLDKVLAKLG